MESAHTVIEVVTKFEQEVARLQINLTQHIRRNLTLQDTIHALRVTLDSKSAMLQASEQRVEGQNEHIKQMTGKIQKFQQEVVKYRHAAKSKDDIITGLEKQLYEAQTQSVPMDDDTVNIVMAVKTDRRDVYQLSGWRIIKILAKQVSAQSAAIKHYQEAITKLHESDSAEGAEESYQAQISLLTAELHAKSAEVLDIQRRYIHLEQVHRSVVLSAPAPNDETLDLSCLMDLVGSASMEMPNGAHFVHARAMVAPVPIPPPALEEAKSVEE